ncbi:multicopy enhancer of UAS2 [Dacryopinax primogenitus]|uniref:S-methyl-5'-thioadenosine phosphorylase n=1 Tax=Dacryopinax primogenitus (strain DJM 731) TaxID=1858805 RepID=M5FZL6_DACPD|nr:multicopy enhancer of UAS2 [Dacryopinax primogenitus]EJT99006.1 multicopy enhancer of UAS2 [Dacryopinax primogenitus]
MGSTEHKVLIGVIGGSGLYHLDNLTPVETVNPETPWGYPSSPLTIAQLPSGGKIAFLARHGVGHQHSPSHVPVRANIAAFKSLGVRVILAFSAVGSLREDIHPGDFVVPSQIIDRTKGIRPSTYFDEGVVGHAMFGNPFDDALIKDLVPLVKEALAPHEVGNGAQVHTEKCVVCMEGPAFSTRAESNMYRMWGGDIINMSVLPEAKLAREAEMSYALIATSTDYDAWRVSEHPVTVEEVVKTLHQNANASRHVAAHVLEALYPDIESGKVGSSFTGTMQFACITKKDYITREAAEKLSWVLPYFS